MGILDTEKTNKHTLLLLSGLILATSCIATMRTEKASTSCGWTMSFGDESLPCGQGTNTSGTVRSTFVGEDWRGYYKITLNNYHGGAFYYPCSGTANSCSLLADTQKVVFELVGDNVITATEGFGIDSFVPIEFIGQGSLKIEAKIPIGGSFLCQWSGASETGKTCFIDETTVIPVKQLDLPTVFITPGTVTKETTPSQNQTSQNRNDIPAENEKGELDGNEDEKKCPDSILVERTSDSGWTVWDIAATIYIGVSLVAFIGLAIRWGLKRKGEKKTQPVETASFTDNNPENNIRDSI